MGDPEKGGSGGPAPVAHVEEPDWLGDIVKALVSAGVPQLAIPFIVAHALITAAKAAAAAREAAIKDMMDRIVAGTSKISLDPSSTEEFRNQTIEYLKELAKTEIGFQLLSDLDSSSFTTTITANTARGNNAVILDPANETEAWVKADGTPGSGCNATIQINPTLTTYAKAGETEEPWMTERAKYGLYHEMVHVRHAHRGNLATGTHNGNGNWEWQAMGMGSPYSSEPITDNKIREAMGKETRPHYDGKTYD